MIFTFRVHFLNGYDTSFKCNVFQLKKKVAERFDNIPMDQIVLIDKDNKLFDQNKGLTQTQMMYANIEQVYKQMDLQKLIMEWSQMKKDNDWQQKTIDKLQKQINELKVQIQQHNQQQQLNQIESQKNNKIINQLQKDLEKQTQLYSQERQQLQNKIRDLQSQQAVNANYYEQQQQKFQNSLQDSNEQLKAADDKIKKYVADTQQLNSQIQEKDKIIQNVNQSYESLYCQFQECQLQYFYNYQQQVTQQYYTYESTIQQLIDEKESLNKKLKTQSTINQASTEKINDLETELIKTKALIRTLQADVKYFQQNKILEQENLEYITQEAQKFKQDLVILKNEKSQLEFEKVQMKTELGYFKQQNELFVQQEQNSLSTGNQALQGEVKSLNTKINELRTENNNLKNQLSDINHTIKDREAKIEHAQQEYQKLQLQLDQFKTTGDNLSQQKKILEQHNQQLQDELNKVKKLYEAEKTNYRTAENVKTQLKEELKQKDIQICSEKISHEASKKEKIYYQEQCQKMADQFKELQRQTTVETLGLQKQVAVANKKIERVLQNFGETKILEKITGPLEKIMASGFKINRFTEDPKSQSDNTQYNLIEITLQFDKYTQYIYEGKFFLIDECFQFGMKINITATRSIQANAESEFYKGYLIKIIESPLQDLKAKTLLSKNLKLQNVPFQNKEQAARLAVNNLYCQWLQTQFNKDIATAKLQTQKQTIQRQFIIENEAKKEFYYCEMVEEGPFSKINGGKFVPQKDDIHQYFNALSLYSYKMLEQQMILTNFQVCGNYVYDMIVHTNHKGLFSPLDQGPHESITFIEILSKQPADIMSKSWNDIIKNQAEKYLRR